MAEFWAWWVDFGAALFGLLVLVVTGYAPATDARNQKFRMAALMLGVIALTSGQFALGQTWWNRDDGQHVQWGPWASFILTIPLAAGITCASMTRHLSVTFWAVILALGASSATYFSAITPLRNGENDRSSAILTVVLAYSAILGLGVYLLAVVMGWTKRWSAQAAVAKGSGTPGIVDSADTSVQSRASRALAVILLCVVIAVYPTLWAAGPIGFRGYTNQTTQTLLLAFLANGLLVLHAAFMYWLVNPDGASAVHMGRALNAPGMSESLLHGTGVDSALASANAAANAVAGAGTAALNAATNANARIGSQMGMPQRALSPTQQRPGQARPAFPVNF
jgi:hypothetical protein